MREQDGSARGRVKVGHGRREWAVAMVALMVAGARADAATASAPPAAVKVELYEWKVEVEPASVRPGRVRFTIENHGSIPHAFEIEGHGVEKSVPQITPGGHAILDATLAPGAFEAYCPIGNGSHKMLGMVTRLHVGSTAARTRGRRAAATAMAMDEGEHAMHAAGPGPAGPQTMHVTGGGTVIQILPGPFPFADSAAAVIAQRPASQQADLSKKAHMGPYSNNVAVVSGRFAITATDRGATGDSVDGTAEFTTQDGARWRLAIDRVQTQDIPFNPRFGGVIMGLYYHGASGVHTPLVPTIQSSLALWAYAHLYRNETLVSDSAMVHVMLLSRTRRDADWSLECWDCSRNPVEELQLQVTPPPGAPPIEAPGGVLFLNWEKSSGELVATR